MTVSHRSYWVQGLGASLPDTAVSSGTGDGVLCRGGGGGGGGLARAGFTRRGRCMVPGPGGKLTALTQHYQVANIC